MVRAFLRGVHLMACSTYRVNGRCGRYSTPAWLPLGRAICSAAHFARLRLQWTPPDGQQQHQRQQHGTPPFFRGVSAAFLQEHVRTKAAIAALRLADRQNGGGSRGGPVSSAAAVSDARRHRQLLQGSAGADAARTRLVDGILVSGCSFSVVVPPPCTEARVLEVVVVVAVCYCVMAGLLLLFLLLLVAVAVVAVVVLM